MRPVLPTSCRMCKGSSRRKVGKTDDQDRGAMDLPLEARFATR
jgi:hypothetical protein